MPPPVAELSPAMRTYLEGLERRLERAGKSLKFQPQQIGPLLGYMRAVQINDPGVPSSMWMGLVGSTPGQAPYQAVTDPNGTIRVELGNLAANGISPAQYGFRANAANGVPPV